MLPCESEIEREREKERERVAGEQFLRWYRAVEEVLFYLRNVRASLPCTLLFPCGDLDAAAADTAVAPPRDTGLTCGLVPMIGAVEV